MKKTVSSMEKQYSENPDTDLLFGRLKNKVKPIFNTAKKHLKKKKRPIYLNDIIGFGGFAVVTKGHLDLSWYGKNLEDKPCAVKIVYPGRIYGDDPDVNDSNRKRFINEYSSTIQVFTNLEKLGTGLEKHIVRAYDIGEFDAEYREKDINMEGLLKIRNIAKIFNKRLISWRYMVSEYVQGKELGQYQNIKIKDLIQIGRTICQVLQVTHEQGFLHRDIKPTNILIPDNNIENLKLGDFGLAKRTDIAVPFYSSILGSVGFSAPEQMDPKARYPVDDRADIYGLAATIYFMASRRYAYNEKDARLLIGKENQMISKTAPLTEYLSEEKIDGLSEVLNVALSPYREKRYSNINEFKKALDDIYTRL